ncbi:MAG: hypothetical protein CYPHOPRED_001509 [Cyphobasidiales sp. Tagirdzhanova-0007]|nr:MAG: hypothetical protein CYPHOPRED_001509 [Cyphobasidiales sp. Tagirdzhanova-0007]
MQLGKAATARLCSSLLFFTAVRGGVFDRAPPPLPQPGGEGKLACRPVGECEVCPDNQMTEPACRVYGNRRMVHCFVLQETNLQKHEAALSPFLPVPESNERPNQYDHLLAAPGKASDESDQIAKAVPPFRLRSARAESTTSGSDKLQQTFPSWEPCARSIDSERKDFWEFILTNLTFAVMALFIVVLRGRLIAARHYNQLVGKIGLPFQLLAKDSSLNGNSDRT